MLRLTLRALRARPMRLVMSATSVMLGIAFLAGVLVFSHGLNTTFDEIVKGSNPSAVVRASTGTTASRGGSDLDPALVERLAGVRGVQRADGQVQALGATLLSSHGKAVGNGGAMTLATSHDGAPNMLGGPSLLLHDGRWPATDEEVVIDPTAARRGGYQVGDRVQLLTASGDHAVRLTLVGTATFNGGGTAGATLIVLTTHAAQQIFLQGRDVYSRIALTAAPGVSQQQLVDAVTPALPVGFEAVTGDRLAKEAQDAIGGFLDSISVFLLIFAIIAVVVSTFIIVNTFTILIAQRTRELALLRALGATRRQVRRSVIAEGVVVGLIAASLGIVVGWLLAHLLAKAFGALGLDIDSSALSLTPRTVVVGYVVGVGVTAFASYLPARRAGRIPPLAALRSESTTPAGFPWPRTAVGLFGVLLGIGFAYLGLGDVQPRPGSPAALVGTGGVLWVLSSAALMPLLARPLLALARLPYRLLLGMPGRLAADNARRDPRRTGATASALMIGLALVSTVAVLAGSLNATITDTINSHFLADFRVHTATDAAFPTTVGDRMEKVAGVATVARQQDLPAMYDGGWILLSGIDGHYLDTHATAVTVGTGTLAAGGALVTTSFASQHDLGIGKQITVAVGGRPVSATIGGIIRGRATTAQVLLPLTALARAGLPRQDTSLSIVLAPGADPETVRAALERAAASAPYLSVDDKQQFSQQLHDSVDGLIYLIYGLLALAVVIAVLGIVNTLSLSVLERTRELGLLRAVGATRAQVRRMVLLESIAIALLGAVVGLTLGVLIGALLQHALRADLTSLGIPGAGLVGFVAAAVVIGALAALAPAIRAGRMSPLSAASE